MYVDWEGQGGGGLQERSAGTHNTASFWAGRGFEVKACRLPATGTQVHSLWISAHRLTGSAAHSLLSGRMSGCVCISVCPGIVAMSSH